MNNDIKQLYLPFKLSKKDAVKKMIKFIKEEDPNDETWIARSISENRIYGSYIPLALIDAKASIRLFGTAEKLVSVYTYRHVYEDHNGNNEGGRVCSVDRWKVERIFDIEIENMILNLNAKQSRKKMSFANMIDNQNIVNAVAPFDFYRAEEWNSEDMGNYNIETIDYDEEGVDLLTETRIKDVARHSILNTVSQYDRGAFWSIEQASIKEKKIKYIYCPVWIFPIDSGTIKRYIVVNARNGKVAGNPASNAKEKYRTTYGMAIGSAVLAILLGLIDPGAFVFIGFFGLLATLFYGFFDTLNYLKVDVRYYHEKETQNKVTNLKQTDEFIGQFDNQPLIPNSNSESVRS